MEALLHKGKSVARGQTQTRILLEAAAGIQDKNIIQALEYLRPWWQKTANGAWKKVMKQHSKTGVLVPGQAPKLTDKQAAHVIAIVCSDAPEGHSHWTSRLQADNGSASF